MNKLEKIKDEVCGKGEYVVRCKKCGINHYQQQYELQIFEVIGYYICSSCAEQMKDCKLLMDREDYEWLVRQGKLKIKIARKIMEILGEDKEGIEVQNITEAKLKAIEELYEK